MLLNALRPRFLIAKTATCFHGIKFAHNCRYFTLNISSQSLSFRTRTLLLKQWCSIGNCSKRRWIRDKEQVNFKKKGGKKWYRRCENRESLLLVRSRSRLICDTEAVKKALRSLDCLSCRGTAVPPTACNKSWNSRVRSIPLPRSQSVKIYTEWFETR